MASGPSSAATTESLADFLAAWAGIPQASAIVSICLAEDHDDTATRAAAKAAWQAIKEAARAALAEAIPQATAIAEKGKAIFDTGLNYFRLFRRCFCLKLWDYSPHGFSTGPALGGAVTPAVGVR